MFQITLWMQYETFSPGAEAPWWWPPWAWRQEREEINSRCEVDWVLWFYPARQQRIASLDNIGSHFFREAKPNLHHAERSWRVCWHVHPKVLSSVLVLTAFLFASISGLFCELDISSVHYILCSFQEVQRLQQDPVCQGPRFHPGQAFKLLSLLIKFLLKNCAWRSFTFVLQINLASVDESTGRMTGGFTTYAICGAIRRWGFVR